MSSTLVSLESLHFLLQHMEANRRFEICQRCPALREFEKSVPLRIKSLVLTERYLTVNDTTYKIGIIRKCNVGEASRLVAERNKFGGFDHEVDRYGIRDESDALTVTPGDVVSNQQEEPFTPIEDYMRALEDVIEDYEEHLAAERVRRPNGNRKNVREIENIIESARAQIFDYQRRRDNVPSIYEFFFQLTKSKTVDKKEQKTIERYKHNKKFSQAMKQMATVLFGGRSCPIHVTNLELNFFFGVIRLPLGLKFHIEQLVFRADSRTPVSILAPILEKTSFPLKKLGIEVWSDEDATNPMVKTAEFLRIVSIMRDVPQTISSITNPVACIFIPGLPKQTIEVLVRNWIETQRPVGYKYVFDYYRGPHFVDEIEEILKRLNGVSVDEENVIIPMSDDTQLKVTYGTFPEFAPDSKWAVRFSTEAIEH